MRSSNKLAAAIVNILQKIGFSFWIIPKLIIEKSSEYLLKYLKTILCSKKATKADKIKYFTYKLPAKY